MAEFMDYFSNPFQVGIAFEVELTRVIYALEIINQIG